MPFDFDIKNTEAYSAIRREKFPLIRFAGILANFFLFAFFLAVIAVLFSIFNASSGFEATGIAILLFCLYFIFWDINLFLQLRIKKIKIDLQDGNLAGHLDFDSAKIILGAAVLCKKKKIALDSSAVLYFAVKINPEVRLICLRLGIEAGRFQQSIRNYLEKIPKIQSSQEYFSENFQKMINLAFRLAGERGHSFIEPDEILSALAFEDEFFKKALVEYDLKPEDVCNLTKWLDSAKAVAGKSREFWSRENLARKGSFGKDFSSGYTITLDKYSIDWRRKVSRWKFREIIGHKKEIEETENILAKSSLANALIVGDSGTGRKSIIEALAQKCYLGTSLPELNNKRVVELDAVMLAAQIPDFEKLEVVLDQVFSEAVASGNVILVIDDLENFVGQKMQKAGVFDICGILSKYLPIPNFKFVGITTYEGLHKSIETNSAFANMFEKIEVQEVTEAETINILQSAGLEAEYKHKILILYPAIREIINLTARYMPSLPFPKKALDVLEESAVYAERHKEKVIQPHHIAEIISRKTEIPVGKMDVKEKEVLLNLENLIHKRLVNQEEAVKEISTAMRRARSGISSKKRPMGTFLFLGPTGVGKTETAKALANIYFGAVEKIVRLDMSEFQRISDIQRLIGSVSPVEMQGLLTTPVRETPFSLILLDEIEKAHPNILNLFLQVLDEGHITDGQGRKVSFANTIIIGTSNAGAEMIFKEVESGKALEKDKLLNYFFEKKIYKPEFINRFDATVIFHPLTKENLLEIAQLSLQDLQKNLKEKDISFEITESLKEEIVHLSYKPEFGAREMRRVIQDKVENAVAEALLADKIKKGDRFQLNPDTFEILVNPVD